MSQRLRRTVRLLRPALVSVPLIAALLLPSHVAAQVAGASADVVDLAAVLRIVRDTSPRLALERQNVAGAEANRITAGAHPNPTVNYGRYRPQGGQATLFDGSRQEEVTFGVPLLISGQRNARIEKAERDIEAARARVIAGASTLAAEAGAAFLSLLAAQEKAALFSQTATELSRLRDIVAGRAEHGVASRYDVARLEVEAGSYRAKLDDARADVADRAGALAVLLGLPKMQPRATGTLTPFALPAGIFAAAQGRAAGSPAVTAAVQEEKAAHSGIDLAQRERWPVPSFSVGRSWTSQPHGAANFLGLSVEMPIFDSRRGLIARAEADASAARLRRELAEAETAAQIERYANMIAAKTTALRNFDDESTSRLPALREMAENAYRFGRSSIFELLDSTRSRHDLQQSRIELAASLIEAQLRFLAASGNLDQVIDATRRPASP